MYIYNNLSCSNLILHLQICLPHGFTTEPLNGLHLTITSYGNTLFCLSGEHVKHGKFSAFHQLVQIYGSGTGSLLFVGQFHPPKWNQSCGTNLYDACCSIDDEQLYCSYCGSEVNTVWYWWLQRIFRASDELWILVKYYISMPGCKQSHKGWASCIQRSRTLFHNNWMTQIENSIFSIPAVSISLEK